MVFLHFGSSPCYCSSKGTALRAVFSKERIRAWPDQETGWGLGVGRSAPLGYWAEAYVLASGPRLEARPRHGGKKQPRVGHRGDRGYKAEPERRGGTKQPGVGKGTVATSLVAEWAWKQVTLRLGRQEKVPEGVGIIPFGERHA